MGIRGGQNKGLDSLTSWKVTEILYISKLLLIREIEDNDGMLKRLL
jgi:hypothetical protein